VDRPEYTGMGVPDIQVMFAQQTRYATPKLGVRWAAFRDEKILLVRNGRTQTAGHYQGAGRM
jgi:hypothetical protein